MKDTKNTKLIELIEDGENQISILQELICFKKVKNRNSNDIKEISLSDLLAISKADISTVIIQRIKDSLISESKDYLTEYETEDGCIYVMPDNSSLSKILDESKKDLNEKDFFNIADFRLLLKECRISSMLVNKIKVLIDEESLNHFLTLSEKTTEELIEDYRENYIFPIVPIVKIAFEISSSRTGLMDYLSNLEISFSRDGLATTNYSFTKKHGYHKMIQKCIEMTNEKHRKIAEDKCTDLLGILQCLEQLD